MPSTARTALVALALVPVALGACGGGDDDDPAGAASGSSSTAAASSTVSSTTASTTTSTTSTTEATTTTTAPETARYSFEDTFDGDTGWVTGCNDKGCAGIEESTFYEDIAAGEKEIDQHAEWDGQALYDVTIETGIVSYGAGNPEGGVVCFADPDAGTYYDFTVGADGQGSVYRFDGGSGEALAGPFTVDGFVPESTVIQAYCGYNDDGTLRLGMAVNGETVADVTDPDPLSPGEVGLITYGDSEVLSTVHYELVTVEASELL
jgi:hypothetical protein